MALEAGRRLSLQAKAAEKHKDIDVDLTNVVTEPVESVRKRATPSQEESSPKNTPVSNVSPPVHKESSPASQDHSPEPLQSSPGLSEVLIKSLANSAKTSSSVPPEPSIPAPVETEVPADPDLEELFAEVDERVEKETTEQGKKRKKAVFPTRMSRRHSTKSSDLPSQSNAEGIEIVEPSPKKPKVTKGSSSKKSDQKKSSKVGGAHKEKDEGIFINGFWFHNEDASSRWELINGRKIISEGSLDLKKWHVPEVLDKLKVAGIFNALQTIKPYSEVLIREFVVNIPEGFGDTLDSEYGMVQVRGKSIQLSPVSINEFLHIDAEATKPKIANWHEVAQVLTNGKITKWTGLTIDSNPLTTSYALLHSICIKNWMPTTHRSSLSKPMAGLLFHIGQGHKVDLGEIIFDQLANQARSKTPKHPIGHPSTIQQLMLLQAPEIINKGDTLTPIKPLLSDWKLFTKDHHIDVSVPQSVKEAIVRKDQGTTKRGKPAKALKPQDSIQLTWLKKHLKSLEAVCKETKAQIALLEQPATDIGSSDEESYQSDSEEDH